MIIPTKLHFQKIKKELGDWFGSKDPTRGKLYLEPCFQQLKINELGQFEKSQHVYLSEKERKALSAIRNTVIHDAENLGLVPIYETKSVKESTVDQEFDIWNRVYEKATYNTRRVCVTIKKCSVKKSPYIQIRPFTAKENEAMKEVAYVNYTLNKFKELSQILGDFMLVDNCKSQYCFVTNYQILFQYLLKKLQINFLNYCFRQNLGKLCLVLTKLKTRMYN